MTDPLFKRESSAYLMVFFSLIKKKGAIGLTIFPNNSSLLCTLRLHDGLCENFKSSDL